MHLSDTEIKHIFANRNLQKPDKTITALSELNCCSKTAIHIYLDSICPAYRTDNNIKKPMKEIEKARQDKIIERKDFPVFEHGELTLPWLFYLNDCVKRGIPFAVIEVELNIDSRLTKRDIEQQYKDWQIF